MGIQIDKIKGPLMHKHKSADISDADTKLLKLDQTTPQKVENGSPQFDEGITIKSGQKIYLDGL